MCTMSVAVQPFTPTGGVLVSTSGASTSVELITNGTSSPAATKALISNIFENLAFIALGDSSVTASSSTGIPVFPGQSITLSIGNNTYLAVTSEAEASLMVNTGY